MLTVSKDNFSIEVQERPSVFTAYLSYHLAIWYLSLKHSDKSFPGK